MRQITKQQARQFILAKQGLLGPYRFSGKDGAYAYVRQAGCIQFDPVDVCGKNAELTLQSRVRYFRKEMLQELLYTDRKLVDYVDKELSIWPTEDWPYFALYRLRSKKTGERFEDMATLCDEAIAYIRENGPVSSDTLPLEGELFWHSSMHWSGSHSRKSYASRAVLEQLYTEGVLIIHHKSGSRKYYDLAEKYLDPSLLRAEDLFTDAEDRLAWRLKRRIGAVGLLWNRNSQALLGLHMKAAERNRIFETLTAAGEIVPVRIEGIRADFYYLKEDEPLMADVLAERLNRRARMEFLAPLDPLLWDKALIRALWDFSYTWEIYTPQDKRKYGSYTLPILYGERFVGRIDLSADYRNRNLTVRGLWWEDGIRITKTLETALANHLKQFAKFSGCV